MKLFCPSLGLALLLPGLLHAQGVRPVPGRPVVAAPAGAGPASQLVRVRSVKAETIGSPEVDIRITGGGSPNQGKRPWLRIRAEYDTAELWSDEITFTFYALLKAKRQEDVGPTGKQFNLFRGSVTYVDVPKGSRHYSDMFLHPDTYTRFAGADKGAVEKVAVVVSVGGQMAAVLSDPADNRRWWDEHAPMPATLLNLEQTPYLLLNLDDHHQIKPGNR
jgi:hypothetical protein